MTGGAQHFLDVYRERVLRRIRNLLIQSTIVSGIGLGLALWADNTVLAWTFTGMMAVVPAWVLPLYFQACHTPDVNVDVELGVRPTMPTGVTRH